VGWTNNVFQGVVDCSQSIQMSACINFNSRYMHVNIFDRWLVVVGKGGESDFLGGLCGWCESLFAHTLPWGLESIASHQTCGHHETGIATL